MKAPLAALLFAAALAPTARSAPAPAPGAALQIEHKTLDTQDGRKVEAEAGQLMVPENRAVAGSRAIPVRFLRLKSMAAKPQAPLFYLAGGPGDHGISESKGAIGFWAKFLPVCDVVLIDQRGVSDPDLHWRWDGPPPLHVFLSADTALSHEAEMNRRALEVFRSRGVDLAGYTTVENAADLEALRVALGLDRVSLLAFSYGTHLACAYLREHSPQVENAVLFGLEGPDQTWKLPWSMDTQFRKLALLAARDPRIAGPIPDLVALYDRVIEKLARQPMVVNIPGPGGERYDVPVGPFGLRFILRADIGDATDLGVFPRLLWSIDHGDPSVLAWFVAKRAGGALGVGAMGEAMDAASGITAGRRALIDAQARTSRFADVVNFPYPVTEKTWPVKDLGDRFRSPVVTDARILLVSGTLDFNTPPAQSEEFRWGATHATHLCVENAGHEQTFFQNETALPVVLDFLSGRDVKDRRITYPLFRFVPLEGSDRLASHPSVSK